MLVGGEDLVHPTSQLGDTGVDRRGGGGAAAAPPGHNANQGPDIVLLTDQRTARVALKHDRNTWDEQEVNPSGEAGGWAGPHHAGSGSGSSGTDHDVRDVAAPVLLALLVGQQGQGGLLQVVGSAGSCGRTG